MQRIPASEKRGRRHSSIVTVTEVTGVAAEPDIDMRDVRVDTYRASGKGGQHRNKTDSAVRMTHIPSGTMVTATEERSQHQNRKVAERRLREALSERQRTQRAQRENEQRAAGFDGGRAFTWTAWRDIVKASDGRSGVMSKALKGDFTGLAA